MKKALILPFLLFIVAVFGQEQQNLIKNGGFEDDFLHWSNLVEDGAKANFSIDSKNKQIGLKALRVDVAALGTKTWSVQSIQGFESKKNKSYEVSFLARNTTGKKQITMYVQNTTYTQNTFALSNKWKVHTWQFSAKEDSLKLSIQFHQKGIFYIDNLIIKEIEGIKKRVWKNSVDNRIINDVNLITNGNFEQGFDGWFNSASKGGEMEVNLNNQTPNEGKKTMRVEVTKLATNPWNIKSVRRINVKKNNRYYVTFYAKTDSENKLVKAQVEDHDQEIYLPFEFISNGTWEKHEFEFTAYSDTMDFIFHHVNLGIVEYDNIKIVRVRKKH